MSIPKISYKSLEEIKSQLPRYKGDLYSNLREKAAYTAYGDVDRFIRWLEGTYHPHGKP